MSVHQRSKVEDDVAVGDVPAMHVLTPTEAWESFDEAARRYVGMSGEAFIATWDAGGFGEDPDRPALIRVAMLRPVGR
ncbi:MAG: hypothetical protein M1118_09335 [Chloroflexi bacterium]|nr:hypothetical protein [Chloroflexota bacterium]